VLTTLGDGTDPSNSTVAPGSADQYLDQFTFVTNTGTDSVTALTVTTANTAAIASMEIWNDALTTQYFSTVSSPTGDTWSFSGGTAIPVTTSSASFRVRFTAKSHAALAAGTYAVTGTVTSYTCTNAQAGTDTDSATITVDNSPPVDATWGTITPGNTQIELNWTNPGADFNKVVILRRAGAAVGDAPTDGTEYNVNDTIGSSTVRYVGSLETFTDTGLTNGTAYYYKIFAYDDYINYASGAATGPHTPDEGGTILGCGECPFNYFAAPVDVSPGTADQWVDVDVSDYVPCGATGVILQVVATSTNRKYGVRKNGSTDTWMAADDTAKALCLTFLMAGLDADRIFEVYTEDTAVTTYLIGYTMPGVTFFTNAKDKSLTVTGSYVTIGITNDTYNEDGAIGAIFVLQNTGGSGYAYSLRKYGSTDDFYNELRASVSTVHLIGVDGSDRAEMKIENLAVDAYLIGYINEGAYFFTNAVDKSTATTGSYVDVDITGDLQGGDDANGAILENATNSTDLFAVRRKGANYDYYKDIRHQGAITAIDDDDVFQQKIEATTHDLYLTGYTLGCSTAANINYRSIGTNTGTLYDTGTASINSGSTTVAFSGGTLPDPSSVGAVGPGDELLLGGETFYIKSRDSATQVTVQTAATGNRSGTPTITRAYNTIQDWEDARDGELVASDSVEVGVCYKDGALEPPSYSTGTASITSGTNIVTFSGGASLPSSVTRYNAIILDVGGANEEVHAIDSRDSATQVTLYTNATNTHTNVSYKIQMFIRIDDSITDSRHYMWLTVAEGQRHDGTEGASGTANAMVDATGWNARVFFVKDPCTRIEWLEIKNGSKDIVNGQPIYVDNDGRHTWLSHLLIHDFKTEKGAINIYGDCTVRNCILYNGTQGAGIRTYDLDEMNVIIENNTIYNMSGTGGDGMYLTKGNVTVRNNISINNSDDDYDIDATIDYFGYNMYDGTGGYEGFDPANYQGNNVNPPGDLSQLFASATPGSEDLHLVNHANNTALDNGRDISLCYVRDIDNEERSGSWDIGADEYGASATVVNLLSFTARGQGTAVRVEWKTAQEINNMGFYLYKSTSRGGSYKRLNAKLIPGLFSSVMGKKYTYEDRDVIRGRLYYYKLEDLDSYGTRTFHGSICVDWDGDGLPDDWEIAYGLNPGVKDAYLDSDGDGLTNLEEYELGTDPFNPDTDGDGILDGDEGWRRDQDMTTRTFAKGVKILSSDATGITLELVTNAFDMEVVEAFGEAYERIRVLDYIHGYTPDAGKPELPVKGILLDLPKGVSAKLTVEDSEAETYSGYWIYPVPENTVSDEGAMAHVGEVFTRDEAAYSTDAFYPNFVAQLGQTYTFRDQKKLQVLFYPFAFNPVRRELRHYSRIRVRVSFEDAGESALMGNSLIGAMAGPPGPGAAVWSPPSEDPAYKILVLEEGIYRLTKTFFTSNGISVSGMHLSQIRLYNLGEEIAIYVYDQGTPDQFDDGDYVEFYGRPVDAAYAKYTKYNVYWLTASGGTGDPKRMTTMSGTPGAGTIAATHTDIATYELDQRYWIEAPGDDSLDRWFFDRLVLGDQIWGGGDPVDFTFSIPGVAGQGSLAISLSGYYDTDHEVTVWLNGDPTPVATLTWSGITAYEGTISPLTLQAGNNTVTLRCESGLDIIYVDRFVATYPRSFAATNNELIFTHDGGYRYQITGFTTNELMAFDITAPTDVARVVNFHITDPPGPYILDCEPQSGAGERTYYTLTTGMVKTPVGVSEDVASALSATANGADYILITHRDLGWDPGGAPYSWLTDLVSLRENQGLRAAVVDVEDIYDEFTYGIVTPQAIKDFISFAYSSWTAPAPQYVLLVGDSNFDCKDNLNQGNVNFIPAYLTFTEYMGEAPTDEWFVRVSGTDSIPDLYIGRLPAASADEAAIMVNKIVAYEGTANTKTWEKNVLLVADNETEGNDYEADFEIMSEEAAALIPTAMSEPFKGYLGDYLATGPLTADIKGEINQGTLIVNYSGHGSTQIWAGEVLFDTNDVPDLTNDDELVFMINMTCQTGYFAYPELGFLNLPSLMEGVLRSEGKGAVAAFMPTGMTTTDGQRILDSALFEAIFTDDIRTLGPAISAAKQTLLANGSHYEEVSETFLLFGDPAMSLKVPLPHRPAGVSLQSTSQGIIVSWNAATDCNGEPVSGYNVYRSPTSGENYTKINTSLITGTEYTDTSAENGTTYYYVVRAVDSDGDESVQSLQLGALAGIGTGSGTPSTGSGCFISTATGEMW